MKYFIFAFAASQWKSWFICHLRCQKLFIRIYDRRLKDDTLECKKYPFFK